MRRAAPLAAAVLALAPALARGAAARAGAAVLRRPLSSRATALADAFAARAGGVSSLGSNPAGAAAAKSPELETTFNSGVLDDAFGYAGYVHPTRLGNVAAGAAYYDAGKVALVEPSGASRTVVAERDYVGLAGWARELGGGLSVGALAKLYRLTLAEAATASGAAGDAGLQWATPLRGLRLGGSVQNVGAAVRFEQDGDPLPLTARGGASWEIDFRPAGPAGYASSRLALSAEAFRVLDERPGFSAAGEYEMGVTASMTAALRLGWTFNQDSGGLAAGFGVRERRYVVDYALAAKRQLGNAHTVSFGLRF